MPKFVDTADWRGIELESTMIGRPSKLTRKWLHEGVYYVTEGEFMMAQLLTELEIPFTPNVTIVLAAPDGKELVYVPDFIFNRTPYVWNREELIHGIEAKGKTGDTFSPKARQKVRLLREQRGINVKLLSDEQIAYFFRKGRLPMRPLFK